MMSDLLGANFVPQGPLWIFRLWVPLLDKAQKIMGAHMGAPVLISKIVGSWQPWQPR